MPDSSAPTGWPDGFVRIRADRDALLVLSHLQRKSPRDIHALAWREGSASACLSAVRGGDGSAGDRAIANDVDPRVVEERLNRMSARAITPADPEYPERLLGLSDPPAVLFVRGRSLSELETAVAIVGARSCSPYGRDAAISLASRLAMAGLTVVSGAALGIDGAAHEGALMSSGYTVAVLGSGLDRPHPRTNEDLIGRIAMEGTVVSEFPPRTEPLPRHFPSRNRIIAGLADGVIVVEGAERSGSLQTAEFAYEDLGRELMAVPGPIDSVLSRAPHELIRNGAALVSDANDVLAALGLLELIDDSSAGPAAVGHEDERRALEVLSGRPASLEDVSRSSGLALNRALVALSGLELRGLAEGRGGRYRLVGQPRRERQTSSEPEKAARVRSAERA
ncbi:MAG: DNA-processing protein DprA [Actinomycetota bacterium]